MAALMLQVPAETARVLHELPVPGNRERHDPHVTVMYLGKNLPIERIGEMLPVIYDVTSKTLPFSVSTSHVSCFPGGDDGVPVIAQIDSPELHRFRKKLTQAFEAADIPYDRKHPEYKPHTTLAYDPDPDTEVDLDIPEVSWGAHELVLWGADRGTGRLVVKFPLSLPNGKVASTSSHAALYRAAVRLSLWGHRDKLVG
jgi:2'-5' RNA ligase